MASLKRLLNESTEEDDMVYVPSVQGSIGAIDTVIGSDIDPSFYGVPEYGAMQSFLESYGDSFEMSGEGFDIDILQDIDPVGLHDGQVAMEWGMQGLLTLANSASNLSLDGISSTDLPESGDSIPGSSEPTAASSVEPEALSGPTMVCFGTLRKKDVKMIGDMAGLDSRFVAEEGRPVDKLQRFSMKQKADHIMLTFADKTEFGSLRVFMTKALEDLIGDREIEFEAIAVTEHLRERISRAQKSSDAMVYVDINIYGQKKNAESVGEKLREKKLWLQRPDYPRHGTEYQNPHVIEFEGVELDNDQSIKDVNNRSRGPRQQPADEQLEKVVSKVYGSLTRSKRHLDKVAEIADERLNILLDHQKEALDFMIQREEGKTPDEYRLWKKKKSDAGIAESYYHAITKSKSRNRPEEKGGGILADEMGMGKSLSILALIVETLQAAQKWADENQQSLELHEDVLKVKCYSRSTLVIVSSALLINNWANEVKIHLNDTLKVVRYHGQSRHGPNRDETLKRIQESDIVVTTYNTLAYEFGKNTGSRGNGSLLHDVAWYRVVLDEAHIIRRQSTTFYQTCAALVANSRWCLTGTPIQNRLEDIGALFAFIRAKPFDSMATFRKYIVTPFEQSLENATFDGIEDDAQNNGTDTATKRLVQLLESCCIRRTRDLLDLRVGREIVRELEWTKDEQDQYERTARILARTIKVRAGEEIQINSKSGAKLGRPAKSVNVEAELLSHNTNNRRGSNGDVGHHDDSADAEMDRDATPTPSSPTLTNRSNSFRPLSSSMPSATNGSNGNSNSAVARKLDSAGGAHGGSGAQQQQQHHHQHPKFGLFQAQLQLRILCNHGTFQKVFSWDRRSKRDEREAALGEAGAGADGLAGRRRRPAGQGVDGGPVENCSGCRQPLPVIARGGGGGGGGNGHGAQQYGDNGASRSLFLDGCAHELCADCLADLPDDDGGVVVDAAADGPRQPRKRRCPICLKGVGTGSGEEDDNHYFQLQGKSTKMEKLMEDVKRDLDDTKSIIFSCWTRTLSLVGKYLNREGIAFHRIDGECPLRKRQEILDEFARPAGKRVLIMTTGTGAFGLNLTSADRVFIVELQWNPSLENQAIARAIRLGQDKAVLVTRYVIKNTIEEDMKKLQRKKRLISEAGFGYGDTADDSQTVT